MDLKPLAILQCEMLRFAPGMRCHIPACIVVIVVRLVPLCHYGVTRRFCITLHHARCQLMAPITAAYRHGSLHALPSGESAQRAPSRAARRTAALPVAWGRAGARSAGVAPRRLGCSAGHLSIYIYLSIQISIVYISTSLYLPTSLWPGLQLFL